jgi:hypothetical protein
MSDPTEFIRREMLAEIKQPRVVQRSPTPRNLH